jgi:hypothetical protein
MKPPFIFSIAILLFLLFGCEEIDINRENASLPSFKSLQKISVTSSSATFEYEIEDDGGAAITARGLCWSTSSSPTLSNDKTLDGKTVGIITCTIQDLTAFTTYYVRAYATNKSGTVYSDEIQFLTMKSIDNIEGQYGIGHITLSKEVTYGDFTFPVGWDVSDDVIPVLVPSSCGNSTTKLDLRVNKELYTSCEGLSGVYKIGTWSQSNDFGKLFLNILYPDPDEPLNTTSVIWPMKNIEIKEHGIVGYIDNFILNSYQGIDLVPPLSLSLRVEMNYVK